MTTTLTFNRGEPDFDWQSILRQVLHTGVYGQTDGSGKGQVTIVSGVLVLQLNSATSDITLSGGSLTAGTITTLSLVANSTVVLNASFSHSVSATSFQSLKGAVPTEAALQIGLAAILGNEPVNATGSADGDVIGGGNKADNLNGADGGDILTGGQGNDTLTGGNGWDDVRYGYELGSEGIIVNLGNTAIVVGAETVAAGTAKDTFGDTDTLNDVEFFSGTAQADYFQSEIGNKGAVHYFMGGGGADTFVGGDGHDGVAYDLPEIESGGGGVIVNLSNATSNGQAAKTARDTFGNTDILVGSIEGANGSGANDILIGRTDGYNRLEGLGGQDLLIGGASDDYIDGGSGNDTIIGGGGSDFFVDGEGNDTYTGSTDPDSFSKISYENQQGGQGINVTFRAGKQITIIDTFGDTDTATNVDQIKGSIYNDLFTGNKKDNSAEGMNGADTFNLGGGWDEVNYDNEQDGGSTHGIIANLSDSKISANIGFGSKNVKANKVLDTFGNVDKLSGVEAIGGTAFKDYLVGGDGDNGLDGNGGNDKIFGGDGENLLSGGDGKDQIVGGDDEDHISGDAGKDKLTGGGGEDDFNFFEMGADNADTITDFRSGVDEIWLFDDAFGLGSGKTLSEKRFLAGDGLSEATKGKHRVIYDTDSGKLYFDHDGKGGDASVLVAVLKGGVELNADDIQLG